MRVSRPVAIAFVAGLTSSLWVKVVGYLSMAELGYAVLTPPYLVTHERRLLAGPLRPFILLALVWLCGALVTDLARSTSPSDLVRGAASIVLWVACLIGQYVMLRHRLDSIKWYTVGLACSHFISIYVFRPGSLLWMAETFGSTIKEATTWRTSYSEVATAAVAALVLFGYRRYPRQAIAGLAAYAVLCLALGTRGLFLTHMLVAAMTFYFYRQQRRALHGRAVRPLSLFQRVRTLVLLGLFGAVALLGYTYAVMRGWLGAEASTRYQSQSESSVGLLSARYDTLCGALAIVDSPIIGHGSWAQDTAGYRARGLALIGLPPSLAFARMAQGGPIPGHSHIITAWVFHGVLGGVYWVFVFGWLVRFMLRYLPGPSEYLPYTLLSVITLSWNILTSPFGQRPATAASLVFLILIAEAADRARGARPGRHATADADDIAPSSDQDPPCTSVS